MRELLYINGKDAYVTWGVFLTDGALDELVAYAPLKPVETVDWGEIDGIQADLTAPRLDTKEATVNFGHHGTRSAGALFEELMAQPYFKLDYRPTGRVYTLRLISEPNLDSISDLHLFSLRFADDFPVSVDYTYQTPQSSIFPSQGFKLDGKELADYGVVVLDGVKDELLRAPDIKQNITININSKHGASYYGPLVKYQSKEVKIPCLMRAANMVEFWRNYDALKYDLIRPGERTLTVSMLGGSFKFFYKSCACEDFYPTGKIWFKFTLTIVLTEHRVTKDNR